MDKKRIREVVTRFADAAKNIYGAKLRGIILYGSCARGDFDVDSDIDFLVLLDVPRENISGEREKILDIADQLDLEYDVVLAPVFQNYDLYRQYMTVSLFYQSVQKEGVIIA